MKLTSSNPQNNLRTTPIQQSSRQRTIINNSCESPGLSLRSSNSKRDSDSRLDFNLLTLSDRRLKGSSFHRRDRSAEEIFGNWTEISLNDTKRSTKQNARLKADSSDVIYKSYDSALQNSVIIPKNSSSKEKILQLNARRLKELNVRQPQESLYPKPPEAKLETITVLGLKPTDDLATLKNICQGWHVVKANVEYNDVEGKCNGTGTVQLRCFQGSEDSERLKFHLVSHGLSVSSISAVRGKKNNYIGAANRPFLDSKISIEEKRASSPFCSSRERKLNMLESTYDIVGNSSSVGRWGNHWRTNSRSGSLSSRSNQENLGLRTNRDLSTERMSLTPSRSTTGPMRSYMKNTLSSQNKRKL